MRWVKGKEEQSKSEACQNGNLSSVKFEKNYLPGNPGCPAGPKLNETKKII